MNRWTAPTAGEFFGAKTSLGAASHPRTRGDNVLVADKLVEPRRAVLFHPRQVRGARAHARSRRHRADLDHIVVHDERGFFFSTERPTSPVHSLKSQESITI